MCLSFETTKARRLMGPCFPTGGLVSTWLLETFTDCFCERVWFCYDIYFIMMLLSQDSECAVMQQTDIYICPKYRTFPFEPPILT